MRTSIALLILTLSNPAQAFETSDCDFQSHGLFAFVRCQIENLYAYGDDSGSRLDALEASVEALGTDLADANLTIAGMESEIGALTTELANANGTIASLSDDIASLQSSVSSLTAGLASEQLRIDALEAGAGACAISGDEDHVFLSCPDGGFATWECPTDWLSASACDLAPGFVSTEGDCTVLIDGLDHQENPFSRLLSPNDANVGEWIQLDFGSAMTLDQIQYQTDWWRSYPRGVDVFVSDDPTMTPGSGATLVHSERNLTAVGTDGSIAFTQFSFDEAGTGRYWYFVNETTPEDKGIHLFEIEFGHSPCSSN